MKKASANTTDGTDSLSSLLLLVRHAHVVEPHLRRHRLLERVLQSGNRLAGTVPRRGGCIQLHRLELIEAHGEPGTAARFWMPVSVLNGTISPVVFFT